MKAFILDRYKKKGTLRLGELPVPESEPNDVLVEVHAAGLNLLDSKIRDGEFKRILPYQPPFVLGHDVAGVVVRVGVNVRRFKPGDQVYARPRDGRVGTFVEFIAIDEADVASKPANIDMEEAASVPLVGLTAWQVLVDRAKLGKGRRSSSMSAPAASGPSPSNWRSISARPSRRRRARRISTSPRVWGPMLWSITRHRTSKRSWPTMTWS
jgi:NADPH:quinone reductase-like Zn-dependent oxidoreductase